MATKTDCDWNRDLQEFDNCCIWAYKACEGKCESYMPKNTEPLKPLEPSCVECEPDDEETLP